MRTAIVTRARHGDEDAFTELVELDGDRSHAIAYRILRDADRAKDAAQQAFILAWRELPRLRDVERYEVWFYRLLVNECYQEARRHQRWTSRVRLLPPEGPAIADPIVVVDDRDALERAFQLLSPQHRAVFVMHHYAGMPLADIAEVVGVPVGTVKSRLHRSIRDLRTALTNDGAIVAVEVYPA